jgi:hypothetical protein
MRVEHSQPIDERSVIINLSPKRQRIYEKADHALDAGKFARAACDGGSENHIAPTSVARQHQRPSACQHRGQSQAMLSDKSVEIGERLLRQSRPALGYSRMRV